MKYDSNTKRQRNQQIITFRERNPEYSLEEIGRLFGITKQRAHQIIKRDKERQVIGSKRG